MQVQSLQLFEQFKLAIYKLTSNNKKATRAHQILPRYRRRRQMSYNFHRLPQFLRPRALTETKSDSLIYKTNAPKMTRKHRRATLKDRLHVYLAKRMKFYHCFPFRNTQKVLRRACQQALIPRTDGYILLEIDGEILTYGTQLLNNSIPVEIYNLGSIKLLLTYELYEQQTLQILQSLQIQSKPSDLVNILLYGETVNILNEVIKSQTHPSDNIFNHTDELQFAENIIPIQEIFAKAPILQQLPPDIQSEVNYLKNLQFHNSIDLKFIRTVKHKKIYPNPLTLRKIESTKSHFEIAVHFNATFASLFLSKENALQFIRKTTRIGIPLAGVLERRFLQFETQFLDLQQFVTFNGVQLRKICNKELGIGPKKQFHPSQKKHIQQVYFEKFLITDSCDWEIQKKKLDTKYKAEKPEIETNLSSIEPFFGVLNYGFSDDKCGFIDKAYRLSAGRESFIGNGKPKLGMII